MQDRKYIRMTSSNHLEIRDRNITSNIDITIIS